MFRPLKLVYFAIGVAIGVLSVIILKHNNVKSLENLQTAKIGSTKNAKYEKWIEKLGYVRQEIPIDFLRYGNKSFNLESKVLYEKVKVLCVILVKNEKNLNDAEQTWAKHCNSVHPVKMLVDNKKMPTRKTKEMSSWSLLCKTLLTINVRDYDWFMIVNDSTFVILENLRLLVAGLNPNEGHYLGHAVTFWSINYNSGKAGYVLSRKSVKLIQKQFNTNSSCVADTTYLNQEDFYLGKILASFNIFPEDTRDSLGLSTFHSFNWQYEFFPHVDYYKSSIYPRKCCSAHSVTFQAIEGDKMYFYYYLLYTLQVFKQGQLGSKPFKQLIPDDHVWKEFIKERGYVGNDISAQEYYRLWEDVVHDPLIFAREIAAHKYEYYED